MSKTQLRSRSIFKSIEILQSHLDSLGCCYDFLLFACEVMLGFVFLFFVLFYVLLCHFMLLYCFAFLDHRARVLAPNETAFISRLLLKSNKYVGTRDS